MRIVYDEVKNERNIRERGLPFDRARDFEFATAVIGAYFRNDEWRELAIGYLDDRLHVLCYTRNDDEVRVISFRRANLREAVRNGKDLRKVH